jgi:hypothetical protein
MRIRRLILPLAGALALCAALSAAAGEASDPAGTAETLPAPAQQTGEPRALGRPLESAEPFNTRPEKKPAMGDSTAVMGRKTLNTVEAFNGKRIGADRPYHPWDTDKDGVVSQQEYMKAYSGLAGGTQDAATLPATDAKP